MQKQNTRVKVWISVGLPYCKSIGTIIRFLWLTMLFASVWKNYFFDKLLQQNSITFTGFWVSLVSQWHWEGLKVDEYIFHCRPNLISRSEYGAMFPATADGITFSRATRTGKLRLISTGFILQYVMIPKLSGGETELASRAQSSEWRKVFKSARSGYIRGIHAELFAL